MILVQINRFEIGLSSTLSFQYGRLLELGLFSPYYTYLEVILGIRKLQCTRAPADREVYRDSLGREQREIPGLVLEWFQQAKGVGPARQRQNRERAERSS